jgi:hypothetical protein
VRRSAQLCVLLAAVEDAVGLARLGARQVHPATRATHQIPDGTVGFRGGFAFIPRIAQGAPYEPHGEHDQEYENEDAHRRIIYPPEKSA